MARKQQKTDIEIFIDKFQPAKYKSLRNGIEVRSVQNVDIQLNKAARLINSLSLKLEVVRDAESACRGAYEVKEVNV